MSDSSANTPEAATRFFDKYLVCLRKASIPVRRRRWYVKRVEKFIKAHNGLRIKSLASPDITSYLETIGREMRLTGWQFRQCVDAIRILYCDLLLTPAAQEVDWRYWYDSASELDVDHPTNAHQYTPEELYHLKARRGEGPMNQVRNRHRDLLVRLSAEIRRRGYAYRTEQSYE